MDAISKQHIDRLAELVAVGARRAAAAFAQLVGEPIAAVEPIVLAQGISHPFDDPEATGVFFELDGCLDAIVGIVFPGPASEILVRRIVGIETGPLEAPIVESAIMEVGNILASHVASAVAEELGERLLPSIPSLAMAGAYEEFEAFIERAAGRDAPRIESGLANVDGTLGGRLMLVPR